MKAAPAIKSDPLLDVRGVSAGYGGVPVLHDVTLRVYPGEIVALVGSNGAGKTTLLRTLSRVLPCTGHIVMKSQDLVPMTSDQVFGVGLVQVPEGRQLFDRMSVQDNLLMGAFKRFDRGAVARDLKRIYALFPAPVGASVASCGKHVGWRTADVRNGSRTDGGAHLVDDRRDEFRASARCRRSAYECIDNDPR